MCLHVLLRGVWTKIIIVMVKVVNCRSVYGKGSSAHKVQFVSNLHIRIHRQFFLTELFYFPRPMILKTTQAMYLAIYTHTYKYYGIINPTTLTVMVNWTLGSDSLTQGRLGGIVY